MKEYEEFYVYWSGPHELQYDEEAEAYSIKSTPIDLDGSLIVYAIYGQHPVFGRDSLLYIGQTKNLNLRSVDHFKKRGRFWYQISPSIHIGSVCDENENPITNQSILSDVEEILIASHVPPMNARTINCPNIKCKDKLVYNFWNRGQLLPICSGYWFDYTDTGK
ncbi:GIY-YIG nuclease family protein [Roseospira marina]|uniref:GIY-YIG nuclease family protein n=1 Tax=Roseospira marina TaxID=140057 RepID=A0A5M6IHG0_9PROT|nr:GIY-YIG nuclease family protein [Roseospira marina]KAA5607664.1 GIY-YIG nuclease family protein [Roseospira marina]